MAFYKGATITWDIPVKVGAGEYTAAQIIAPYMEKYLGATINLVSLPAGVGVVGQNTVAAANPDGLTIGFETTKDDIFDDIDGVSNVNFQLNNQQIVGGLRQNLQVLGIAPSAPDKTFSQLVSSKGPVTSVDASSDVFVVQKIIMSAYGINTTYRTGYSSLTDAAAGWLRGDGQLLMQSVINIESLLTANKIRPLLVSYAPPAGSAAYAELEGVPTFASYLAQNPPANASAAKALTVLSTTFAVNSSNSAVFAPAKTPATRVAALAAAFKYAMSQSSVEAALNKAGQTPGYVSPAAVHQDLSSLIDSSKVLTQFDKQ
jgi:tripartite-type tricarboxylate transporter receptor subunit TctC